MAKGRMLNASISLSDQVAELADDTQRLLFTWAIAHLDRDGRVEGDPRRFRARVCPMLEHVTTAVTAAALIRMVERRLVVAYEDADGQRALVFTGFRRGQIGLRVDREAASRFGAPPPVIEHLLGVVPKWLWEASSEFPQKTQDSGVTPHELGVAPAEQNRMEQKQTEEIAVPTAHEPDGSAPSDSVPAIAPVQSDSTAPAAPTDTADDNPTLPALSQPHLALVEAPPPPSLEEQIFAEYVAGWRKHVVRGTRPPTLDEKRRRMIRARIRDFDKPDLIAAARGIWLDPWYLENHQISIDLVMRDAAHVERFRDIAIHGPGSRARTISLVRNSDVQRGGWDSMRDANTTLPAEIMDPIDPAVGETF